MNDMYVYVVMCRERDYDAETSVYAICLDSEKADEILKQARKKLRNYRFWLTPPVLVEKS